MENDDDDMVFVMKLRSGENGGEGLMSASEMAYLKWVDTMMKVEETMGFRVKVGVWKFLFTVFCLDVNKMKWKLKQKKFSQWCTLRMKSLTGVQMQKLKDDEEIFHISELNQLIRAVHITLSRNYGSKPNLRGILKMALAYAHKWLFR